MKKITILFHTQTKHNTQITLKKPFAQDRKWKLRVGRVAIIWYQRVYFFQRRHTKFYLEDTL